MLTETKDIIQTLQSLSDPKRKKFGERTYPSAMEIIGVTVPNLRLVLNQLKIVTTTYTQVQKLNLAQKLCHSNYFEAHQLSLEWIGADKRLMKALSAKNAESLQTNMDNWVSVDTYANLILGPLWQRDEVSTSKIHTLALDTKNMWNRRMALAATVPLNKKTRTKTGDSVKTLGVCELAVSDHQDMVVKALSWALRSLLHWDRPGVEAFLRTHADALHKRVIREVNHKLDTGYKS